MEEKNIGGTIVGVDLSSYSSYQKRRKTITDPDKGKNKNKLYLAIIALCVVAMAVLWGYYFSQSQSGEAGVPYSSIPAE